MSDPNLLEFNPKLIPWQYNCLKDIRKNFDYGDGPNNRILHEVMLSGSVGSAKSILMAHIVVSHCVMNAGACALLGRLSMPDLKATLLADVLKQLDGALEEGVDYIYNKAMAKVEFSNGSSIISRSWHDKNFKSKFRSLRLSLVAIEELTENEGEYWEFYKEMRMRIPRLPYIKEALIICATNPDSPSHPAYEYFIVGEQKYSTRHVYYSLTEQNPFLGKNYIEQLKQDLDPLTAKRMLYGQWIYINTDVIYHQYNPKMHYRNRDYRIDPKHAIRISFDFNIGQGKPMSAVICQYYTNTFHFFNQSVIEGANTEQIMEDLMNRGLLDYETEYFIHGDATGRARNPASKGHNYDVIEQFLSNYRQPSGLKIHYKIDVPTINPPVRTRHNLVNGYMFNMKKQIRLFVYKDCPVLNEGFLKTKLKKGGAYIEDDGPSHPYQHATTAAGYLIYYVHEYCMNSDSVIQFS